jgi:zinc protease
MLFFLMTIHRFGDRARGAPRARLYRPLLVALAGGALLLYGCATMRPGASVSAGSSVLRATLDNGLRVILVKTSLAPVVAQQLTFFAGANQSPLGFPGMAHAQEHMMFRGSREMSGDQLSAITAQLGGDQNAFTASTTTTYYHTVPADDLDLTLRMDAIRLAGVDNDQAAWEKERGAIEQEVARDNSSPSYVLQEKARERIFAGTPYSNTGLGTKSSFDQTTADMLRSFHESWYAPNNALLVLVGDLDPEAVLAKVKQLYGPIPRKPVPPREEIALQPVVSDTFSSTTDQPYGFVAYIFRAPGYRAPDYPAAQILSRVMDSPRGAITGLAYEGKALNAGFSMQTFPDTGYATAWAAFPQGGDEKALAEELKGAVKQAMAGIPADLVEAERRRVVLENALQGNSISGLADSWTDAVAVKGLDSPDREAAMLQKVDPSAVSAAAARLLDFDHAITLVLVPAPSGQALKGGQAFGAPESFASTPDRPVELPAWADAALAKLPHPTPLFSPSVFDLSNGLRLIVQPLSSTDAVSLYGSVHTSENLQAPAGQEGVEDMMNTLFAWGPKGMSRADFEAAWDSIGADYSAGTSFSLNVLPEYFTRGVELLSNDLLNPALPPDAFASQQPIQSRQAAGNVQSPVFQFRIAIQKGLVPAGDPSLRRPTPESISSLTVDSVRAYHEAVMRPDQTTIVVMGKIEPQTARAVIEKYFGAWKKSGPKPMLDYQPVSASAPSEVFINDAVREQNEVVLSETLPLTYTDPVHHALRLGSEFLGGDSFASPLYRELRVKRGLVYSVGSSAGFGRTRSQFSLSFGAYPDKVKEARQIALQLVKAMAEAPLSEQDLHLAKGQSLRQIELSNQTASDIAQNWIGYNEEGLSLNRMFEVARAYEGLTAAEIQAAFRKYVEPDRLSTFVLGQPYGR